MKSLIVSACILVIALAGCSNDDPVGNDTPGTAKVAAVVALSGSLSNLGPTAKAAIELALEDAKQEFGADLGFEDIPVFDSHTNADSALARITALREAGYHIIIGPQSSAEVEQVRSYADANNVLILSPSSVARSLAVPGDNVFRFATDDTYQADAMSTFIGTDSLDALIVVFRDDVWGIDLASYASQVYRSRGGNIVDSIAYSSTASDFSGMLSSLQMRVDEAVSQYGADKVGIYLLSFGEAASILSQASDVPSLGRVKWYGASAVAQSPAIVSNSKAAEFAQSVGFPCAVFGLGEETESVWGNTAARIEERSGQPADAYSLVAYDIVFTIARNLRGGGIDDFQAFKARLPQTAAANAGLTGSLELNQAGDRKQGKYDFWAIRDSGEGPKWTQIALYDTESGAFDRWD